jgi:hypothetical protein
MNNKTVATSHSNVSYPILQIIKVRKTKAKGNAQTQREATPQNKVTDASNSNRQMVLSGKWTKYSSGLVDEELDDR